MRATVTWLQFSQAGQVSLQHVDLPKTRFHAVKQCSLETLGPFGNGVVLPFTLLSHGHEAGPPQVGKVSRGVGLGEVKHLTKLADAQLALQQQVQQSQASLVGKRAEDRMG